MNIISHEYNEYVIGFIVHTTKGDINLQFEKAFSNHPEPAYKLFPACEGDETADHLTEMEKEQLIDYAHACKEMNDLEESYTTARYNGSKLPEMCAPISKSEIEELAITDDRY